MKKFNKTVASLFTVTALLVSIGGVYVQDTHNHSNYWESKKDPGELH